MQITRYKVATTFDITQTGVIGKFRPDTLPFVASNGDAIENPMAWTQARNKQRNLEALIQVLCMRAQMDQVSTPVKVDDRWVFTFISDTENAFGENLELFAQDAASVPMIPIEDGTLSDALIPSGEGQNVWLEIF